MHDERRAATTCFLVAVRPTRRTVRKTCHNGRLFRSSFCVLTKALGLFKERIDITGKVEIVGIEVIT
jgi:hypothetical protein